MARLCTLLPESEPGCTLYVEAWNVKCDGLEHSLSFTMGHHATVHLRHMLTRDVECANDICLAAHRAHSHHTQQAFWCYNKYEMSAPNGGILLLPQGPASTVASGLSFVVLLVLPLAAAGSCRLCCPCSRGHPSVSCSTLPWLLSLAGCFPNLLLILILP